MSVAAQIDGDHAMRAGQQRHQLVPIMQAAAEAVQQDERLSCSFLHIRELDAVCQLCFFFI